MANFGLQEFSTQEAVNFEAYTDWNWEKLDLATDETDDTSTYITATNPDNNGELFEPAQDKIYRHPTFYDLPDEIKHM